MDVFVWQNARTFAHTNIYTHAKSRQNKQLIIILFIHSTRPLLCQSIKIQLSMYFFLLLRLRLPLLLLLLLPLSHTIHDSQFFSCRLLIRLYAFLRLHLHLLPPFVCVFLSILYSFIVCTMMFSCVHLLLPRIAVGITICVSTERNMFRLGDDGNKTVL